MSIIYEALKKVEKSQIIPTEIPLQDKPAKKSAKTNKIKFTHIAIYFFALVAGIFTANIIFGIISKPHPQASLAKNTPPPAIPPPPASPPPASVTLPTAPAAVTAPAQPAPASVKKESSPNELTLNGLFFSGNTGYVLINNRVLKEGDEISGATIKRITLDGAELEFNGSIIKLSNNQ